MDKAGFPRDKVCAGWITPAVIEALQLDTADYARRHVLQPITAFRTGLIDGDEYHRLKTRLIDGFQPQRIPAARIVKPALWAALVPSLVPLVVAGEAASGRAALELLSSQPADVVVLDINPHSDLLIKRVIGLPGDRVEIRGGQVFINGKLLNEPYLSQPTYGDYGPIDVPPLHVFVLGDNRGFSNDSRAFGPIPLDDVVGRAWFSYWPPGQWGLIR